MRSRAFVASLAALIVAAAACGTSPEVRSVGAAGAGDRQATTTQPATTAPATTGADTTVPDTTAADTTVPDTTEAPAPALEWSSCGTRVECATLTVPMDYANPDGGTIDLHVVRAPARQRNQRIGSLLVNPGGPGFGGSFLAENASAFFTRALLDRFDIVGWDPRGTGESEPAVDCIDQYDPYFSLDITPDDASEQQALEKASLDFAQACADNNGALLAHISTIDSARDMDTLRRALGEDKISYFGFSYGSELGTTWATMFPQTVRAMVIDGAVDPTSTGIQRGIDQAQGFEIALNAFLDHCRGKCAFAQGGDPGAALDQILADIDANTYPTRPGRPTLTQGIAYIGIVDAMYSEQSWPELANALEAARNGDGSGLLDLYDDYFQRYPDGSYGNELEAFYAISCLDDAGPTTVAGVDEFNDDFEQAAPRIGPSFTHSYQCVFWPVPSVPKLDITGKGAGPILVIGTTNDPATPYESTKRMARALERGILITVKGNGHLGYGQSPCAQDLVDGYLVDLDVPNGDIEC